MMNGNRMSTWVAEIPAGVAKGIVVLPEYVEDHSALCQLYQKKGEDRYFWYAGRLGRGIVKVEATGDPRYHSSRITYYLAVGGKWPVSEEEEAMSIW